eukprot:CAMPEP_0116014790 /NCGR_PEP_ID=MMETSP0321-20121206/6463_1 /TAXON_ID=163516 /ORGANISM="Leptocylindrus danicus var. danicus, Strain B650" /LENGTH=769 /DNA_ID=CAMNT_0003484461 /DNA_START=103 /DNA_END=2413 /DNA_ORIENTATION=-
MTSTRIPSTTAHAQLLEQQGYAILPRFLPQHECLKYEIQFLETVSPRFKGHDASTWNARDHHTLKGTRTDPIPQILPRTRPSLVATRGAGWILGDLREYLADQVFAEHVYDGSHELLCERVEGFSVVRPDDDCIEYDLLIPQGKEDKTVKQMYYQALVVLSKYAAKLVTTTCCGTPQQRTEVDLQQGDIVLYSNNSEFNCTLVNKFINYIDDDPAELCSSSKNLAFFDHVSIRPATFTKEEDNVVNGSSGAQTYPWENRLDSYIFAQTFSSDGSLHCEGYDEVGRNMDEQRLRNQDECKINGADEKVRMVKTYQQIRGHQRLNVRRAQLYGFIPYTDNPETDVANLSDLESELERRGVWYEGDAREIHPQLVSLDCSDFRNLAGQDKWLGGVGSPCGRFIYGVPGTATQVLRVTVSSGKVDLIGPHFTGKFKWLRGVPIPASVMGKESFPSGACIAIPCNSKSVLRIDPHSDEVIAFGHKTLEKMGKWLYHGGELASDGYVYAIPANAERVLKIDPRTLETSLIGPVFEGVQKWYGGLLGGNGAIYGIPQNSTGCLKIDPESQEVTIVGEGTLSEGRYKWHGGLSTADKRFIYGFPNHEDKVLKLDTLTDKITLIGEPGVILAGRHRIPQDNKYKYLGGAITPEGKAFLFPCEAERVLMIDTNTDVVKCVGPLLLEGENKYQNGFCCSDGVYGIPQRARGVLKISVCEDDGSNDGVKVEVLNCGDNIGAYKDKFEGGVLGQDGCVYCMPLICKDVVKVVPKPFQARDNE